MPPANTTVYKYHLSGYIFKTNFALPELNIALGDEDCCLTVCSTVPPQVPAGALAVPFYHNPEMGLTCFNPPLTGIIAVFNNKDIVYVPAPALKEEEIRMQILGTVAMMMSAMLGFVSFHASCVIINQKAVLFCGKSGLGKSSLAGYFYSKGYTVLSDDVTNVKLSDTGKLMAFPSIPRIKLSEDILTTSGISSNGLPKFTGKKIKFAMPAVFQTTAFELGKIVILAFEDGNDILEALPGSGNKMLLSQHIYRKKNPVLQQFRLAKNTTLFNIISTVKMYGFSRPGSESSINESFLFLENKLRELYEI